MLDDTMHDDKEYWHSLKWPACPNADDYNVFKMYAQGSVLLLGSTPALLPLATVAWDINPKIDDPKIINRDWCDLDQHYDTIIGDGLLSFGKEFAEKLIPVLLSHCDRLVLRCFLNPNWKTKYAVYFPKAHELTPVPNEHPISEVYTFYIWNNKK